MTPQQVRVALEKYATELEGLGVRPQRVNMEVTSPDILAQRSHLLWMCLEAKTFVADETPSAASLEKAMRWLGFLQGALWSLGVYSIDQMKDDNR